MLTTARHRRIAVQRSVFIAGVAALTVLFGVPAKAYELQELYGNDEGEVEVVVPSGNIGSIYTPEGQHIGL